MPDLREVFEMVKQQTEPDLDSWVEQERRLRRAGRNRKLGTYALVAALAAGAVVVVQNVRDDDPERIVPADRNESVAPPGDPGSGFNLYDLDTGDMTSTGIRATSSAVDVSPDGTKIAYVDSPSGTGDTVHVANVDGSNIQEFARTNLAGDAKAPRWSPDGTKVVFQGRPSSGGRIGNIYVLDVTTGRVEQITDLEQVTAGVWWMAPTFSSDGQTVFFNEPRRAGIGADDIGQGWDLWSVPASGGEPTLVRRNAFMADVSPTGDAIAYIEARSGDAGFETGGVYVARPDGTDARKIAGGPSAEFPRWSPEGSKIAYSADGEVHIIDVETGDIDDEVGAFSWPEWVDADTLMIEVGVG
jgi:Tol biopolymer transport system component